MIRIVVVALTIAVAVAILAAVGSRLLGIAPNLGVMAALGTVAGASYAAEAMIRATAAGSSGRHDRAARPHDPHHADATHHAS
jgi:hypothetical protein